MVPKQHGKSTQVMQWAAAGLLAASLSACSAAGVVGQVQSELQSRISRASNPQPAALQTTAQPGATATSTTPQNVVTTSQDQLYEALYAKINPSVVNITVIEGAATGGNSSRNNPFGTGTPAP